MLERVLHLRRLMQAGKRPLDRLLELQAAKLARLFDHAADSAPFYRERLAAFGAGDFRSPLERLAALPVLSRTELRAAASSAWDGPARVDDRWIATSGSTGDPLRFPITESHDQLRKAQYLRPYLANGRTFRDRVVRLTAFPRSPPWFARMGLLHETQIACDVGPERVVEALLESGAGVLQGYPSGLRLLAHHLRASGTPPPPVRLVFTDSELLTADSRELIESTFGVPVRDVYGSYETDNIAFECSAGDGYHLTIDTVVVELLRGGEPVAPGEDGEVVVTVLDNLRSPLIRYNLGDVARWEPGPCRCGNAFPRLRITGGRTDSLLLWPDGSRRSPMRVLALLDEFAEDLVRFQLIQGADLDCELRYVPARTAPHGLATRLWEALLPQLGGCTLTLTAVDSIPLTRAGKLRSFMRVDPQGQGTAPTAQDRAG